MFDFVRYLEDRRAEVDRLLDQKLPPASTRPAILHQAMRYSLLGEAKRIRPILAMAAAEALGKDRRIALLPGTAIELLHTYTLIHDDLPAMDDDAMRRGRPSCHVAFGEANAILAGDALLTLAFEWMSECLAPPPFEPNRLALELARAAGSEGVIGGQVEDLAAEGTEPDAERVEYIHRHKTADLLRAAVRIGGIAAGATAKQLEALDAYGDAAGLAFQVADDLLNAGGDAAAMGKNTGTDAARKKMTYVAVYGFAEAKRRAEALVSRAVTACDALPGDTEPLRAIARFILSRST